MASELTEIADEVDTHTSALRDLRVRQRAAIAREIRVNHRTWVDVQQEARVSRATVTNALRKYEAEPA